MQPTIKYLLLAVSFLLSLKESLSCSAYKLTVGNKTMIGSNYDSWLTQPHIWFETSGYGAYFTGARPIGKSEFAPQTGMNVHGLAFVTLATATPSTQKDFSQLKKVNNRAQFLKDIIHHCKDVDEVKAYVSQYDRSELNQDVFLYADQSGHYLVVEPFELIEGYDDRYILANFCPSTVQDFGTIQQRRYVDGRNFVSHKIDTTLSFCTQLSDTMHVCREKFGDGTLLTSILDLKTNHVHLFFYHDYEHRVSLDLDEELKKGDHRIDLLTLFPVNAEFEVLRQHKTPMNSPTIAMFVMIFLLAFFLIALLMIISYFAGKGSIQHNRWKILVAFVALVFSWMMYVLGTQEGIYYFAAPYHTGTSSLINIAGYIPFASVLIIVPALMMSYRLIRKKTWGILPAYAFLMMNMMIIVSISGFMYWRLFDVF
ncbi:MAG: hypothetical protein K1X54_14230 [Flavobacteriales bacterium]|nr:hypothetical protein [Flavobacteriales bacterium]